VQAEAALENLGTALVAAGAGPVDVTMLRLYIVGARPRSPQRWVREWRSAFSGVKPPASTWVGVQALFHPAFLIEIEPMAGVRNRR
jgi:enamine deaminase RidA (YjgF/YER057c/UK114 family)